MKILKRSCEEKRFSSETDFTTSFGRDSPAGRGSVGRISPSLVMAPGWGPGRRAGNPFPALEESYFMVSLSTAMKH